MKKTELKQLIKEEIDNIKVLQYFQKDKDAKNGFYVFEKGSNILSKYSPDYKDVEKYKTDDYIIVSLKNDKKQIIKEELGRYMFFQNLKTIKQAVDEMLKLDEKMVDGILASGHDWAADHVATSKDDIEEVHSFLMSKKVAGPVGMDENEESKLKIGDKVKYENQEWEVIDIFRTGEVRLKHLKGLPSTNVMASKAIKIQEKKLSPKQMKIAKAAPPDDKITGADFAALRKGK